MSDASTLRRYQRYINSIMPIAGLYDFADKPDCVDQHVTYMFNRTQSMFEWRGLPETVPQRWLELYLQRNGHVAWLEVNGDLYVMTGGMGGKPTPYYMPTIYTVANPGFDPAFSATLEIGKDCVLMPNDSLYMGLMPMFSRYATAMTETELSMKIATINSRIVSVMSASDDATRESAELYLESIEDGELGVIGENAFLDGVKTQPYGATGSAQQITDLIELEQYWKASWFNDLGLNANYNMKRESLNSEESQLNNDALLPLVDNMLACRQEFAERVNEMFGTEISVDLASSWEDNAEEIELEHGEMAANGNAEFEEENEDENTNEDDENDAGEGNSGVDD